MPKKTVVISRDRSVYSSQPGAHGMCRRLRTSLLHLIAGSVALSGVALATSVSVFHAENSPGLCGIENLETVSLIQMRDTEYSDDQAIDCGTASVNDSVQQWYHAPQSGSSQGYITIRIHRGDCSQEGMFYEVNQGGGSSKTRDFLVGSNASVSYNCSK